MHMIPKIIVNSSSVKARIEFSVLQKMLRFYALCTQFMYGKGSVAVRCTYMFSRIARADVVYRISISHNGNVDMRCWLGTQEYSVGC